MENENTTKMTIFHNDTPMDLTYLSWSLSKESSGTAGSFLKSYELVEGQKIYYKMSNYDSVKGVIGHESINEMVAQNLADLYGFEHLKYELVYGRVNVSGKEFVTWITRSADFKKPGESKLTFEIYYEIMRMENESKLGFINRMGLNDYFYNMFILDYLICNRDRHGANIEVLQENDQYRLAPLFDNGLSFMFSCYKNGEEMEKYDYLKDGPVNNFIGSMQLSENLRLVPKEYLDKIFVPSKEQLFKGLNMGMKEMPKQYWDCMYQMVKERVDYVKNL